MEGVRGYWKRRGYRRLKASRVPRQAAATRFGRRRLRLNILKIARSISPKKWLPRLRDAYVDMMLGWSSSRAFDTGMSGLGKAPLKEYDEKVMVELYRLILLTQLQDKATATPIVRIPSRVSDEIEV